MVKNLNLTTNQVGIILFALEKELKFWETTENKNKIAELKELIKTINP